MKGLAILGISGSLLFSVSTLLLAAEEESAALPALPFSEEIITSEVRHKFTLQTGYGPAESQLGADRESFYSLRYEPTFIWYSPEKRWSQWEVFTRG